MRRDWLKMLLLRCLLIYTSGSDDNGDVKTKDSDDDKLTAGAPGPLGPTGWPDELVIARTEEYSGLATSVGGIVHAKAHFASSITVENDSWVLDADSLISTQDSVIEETLDLLQEGEDNLQVSGKHERNILIIGNSGSGKTTLGLLLTAADKLIVKKNSLGLITIHDESNLIGKETTLSKTLIPNRFPNLKENVTFYDCPGFRDNRKPLIELVNTVFMKKVTEHSYNTKIVMVVNYASVSLADKNDFRDLIESTLKLLRIFPRFKDSIVIVANKVKEWPEVDVTQVVAAYLRLYKSDIPQMDLSKEEKEIRSALIDALLEQDGERYKRIAFFRAPRQEGRLSEIPAVQENQREIEQVVYGGAEFCQTNPDDFGYSTSNTIREFSRQILSAVDRKIYLTLYALAQDIQADVLQKSAEMYSMNTFQTYFQRIRDGAELIARGNYTTAKDLVYSTLDLVQANQIPERVPHPVQMIPMMDTAVQLIQTIFPDLSPDPQTWARRIKELSGELYTAQSWYKFLVNLHDHLSQLDIQKHKKRYVQDWGIENGNNVYVSSQAFPSLLEKIKSDVSVQSEVECQDLIMSANKPNHLQELNSALRHALKSNHPPSYSSNELLVQGHYVLLSEAVEYARSYVPLRRLAIVATDTVFIDVDVLATKINQNKIFDMELFAPTWVVLNERKIDLSGANGTTTHEPAASGDHGKPGGLGMNAGHFRGRAVTINSGQLNIIANGGDGGNGQPGGKGRDGANGATPQKSDVSYPRKNTCAPAYGLVVDISSSFKVSGVKERYCCRGLGICDCEKYEVYGKKGDDGQRGGDGGSGGSGGVRGNIDLLVTQSNGNHYHIYTENGQYGVHGVGGIGGSGGKGGTNCQAKFSQTLTMNWKLDSICSIEFGLYCEGIGVALEGKSASQGTTGANWRGMEKPEKFDNILDRSSKYISAYVAAASSNDDPFVYTLNQELLQQIHNEDLLRVYGVEGLIKEFQMVEEITNSVKSDRLVPVFHALLSKISTLAKNYFYDPKRISVLPSLYTAALGRLVTLQNNPNPVAVTDIRVYLDTEIRTINELCKIDLSLRSLAAIQRNRDDYEKMIAERFLEANRFIDQDIVPAVDSIGKELKNQTDDLMGEIQSLVVAEKENTVVLRQNKAKLEKQLITNAVFGGLKLFSSVLSFLGPKGAAAGAVLDLGTNIAQSFFPKENMGQLKPIILPNAIKNYNSKAAERLREQLQSRLKALNTQFDVIGSHIEGYPEFVNVSNKISQFQDRIKNQMKPRQKRETTWYVSPSGLTEQMREVVTAEQTADNDLSVIRQDLQEVQDKVLKEKPKDYAAIIKKQAELAQKSATALTGLLSTISADKAAIARVEKEIGKSDKTVQKLENHMKNVVTNMLPQVLDVMSHMDKVIEGSASQSEVSLVIGRWKVQGLIRDMKLAVKKLYTEGFQMEEYMARGLDKLEEAMTVLLELYERLQKFNDQRTLTNFIANLAEVGQPIGTGLDKELQQLKYTIHANAILQRYQIVVDSFNMWAFPFGETYTPTTCRKTQFSHQVMTEVDLKGRIDAVSQCFNDMNTRKNLDQSSISEVDQFIRRTTFTCEQGWNPLYIWKNVTDRCSISSLLSDNKHPTLFRANVARSPGGMDCVKFKSLHLQFVSPTGDTVQEQKLAEALESYNLIMTHNGTSYYRFLGRYYSISGNRLILTSSFSLDNSGKPMTTALVNEKLFNGDLIFSPYTFWEILIQPKISENDDVSYRPPSLEPFINQFDVRLYGKGSYVQKSLKLDKFNVQNFYKEDNTVAPESPFTRAEMCTLKSPIPTGVFK